MNPREHGAQNERFLSLLAANQKRIMGYVYSLVPHAQDAEDICQKVSIVLWRKFDQFEVDGGEGNFIAWACRIAYLEVCNFRRTASRDRHCFSDELLSYLAEERIEDLSHVNGRMDALRECVQQLGQPQQELLQHAYADEQSMGQLADQLGKAVQTIYNRLFRIRRILFDCVEERLAKESLS